MSDARRIPSLDGLRAVSIALVLWGHAAGTRGFIHLAKTWEHFLDFSEIGVRVFFVISGYLISTLLFREQEQAGSISLGRFYFRRTMRIFPAYYALLAVVGVLVATREAAVMPGDFLHALTYTTNYHAIRSWYVGHTWSLSVEEQFYLLWPATVALLGRSGAVFGAAAVMVLVPILRVVSWRMIPESRPLIGETFQTTADAIAAGCLLAGARDWLRGDWLWTRLMHARTWWVVPLATILLSRLRDHPSVDLSLGMTLTNIGIAWTIDRSLVRPDRDLGRLLNWAPAVFVGTMSYSLYLWQQLFLNRRSTAAWCAFPTNVILAVVCAWLSYHWIERPMLALRQRIEPRLMVKRRASTRLTA